MACVMASALATILLCVMYKLLATTHLLFVINNLSQLISSRVVRRVRLQGRS